MTFAVIATVVAIGALDELRQAGLHGRSADVFVFVADACAGVAMYTTMLLHARKTIQDRCKGQRHLGNRRGRCPA